MADVEALTELMASLSLKTTTPQPSSCVEHHLSLVDLMASLSLKETAYSTAPSEVADDQSQPQRRTVQFETHSTLVVANLSNHNNFNVVPSSFSSTTNPHPIFLTVDLYQIPAPLSRTEHYFLFSLFSVLLHSFSPHLIPPISLNCYSVCYFVTLWESVPFSRRFQREKSNLIAKPFHVYYSPGFDAASSSKTGQKNFGAIAANMVQNISPELENGVTVEDDDLLEMMDYRFSTEEQGIMAVKDNQTATKSIVAARGSPFTINSAGPIGSGQLDQRGGGFICRPAGLDHVRPLENILKSVGLPIAGCQVSTESLQPAPKRRRPEEFLEDSSLQED